MPVLGVLGSGGGGALTGNPNYRYLKPVGAHTGMAHIGTFGNGSNAASYLVRHPVAVDTKTIALVFSNTVQQAADGPNAITIKAALRRSDTALIPLTFNGQTSITLQPGCDAISDPVTCPVNAGDYVQSITYVSVAAAGLWPQNVQIYRVFNQEGYIAGSDRTRDFGALGDWDMGTNRSAFGPTLVLGSTASTLPVIGVEGDSITVGQNDSTLNGHWERGLSGAFPLALIGNGGVTAASVAGFYTSVRRLTWLGGCGHIVNAYGPNDLAGAASAATVAATFLTLWAARKSTGAKVYQATIPPNTTSTDSWASAGNQTVKSLETARVQINDWLRNGAKVDGSGVAIFDGTGTASPLLTGIIDLADAYETARNSGKWKSPGYTADGIHPSTAGYTATAAVVAAWAATLS